MTTGAPLLLPSPAIAAPGSIETAFARRRTIRAISPRLLPSQTLADLLWAACGVNRTTGPFGCSGRTAASASNSREIDVYVLMQTGAFRYDAEANALAAVKFGDYRAFGLTPRQSGVTATAPMQLVFVVDIEKLTHTSGFDEPGLHDPDVQKSYYFVDTGMIAANVHLYAAAHDLAAWFHNCDRERLADVLQLRPAQRVLFAQSVGFPTPS
jgi:Nitroreductase family